MVGGPRVVRLPGQVWGVAAPGPDGPLIATTYDGDDLSSTVVTALNLWTISAATPGRRAWRR